MARTYLLGGDLGGRGLLGGRRSRIENAGLVASLAVGALLALGSSVYDLATGAAVFGAGVALFWRWGRHSLAATLGNQVRYLVRDRLGHTQFVPEPVVDAAGGAVVPARTDGRRPRLSRAPQARLVPEAVGAVRVINFDTPTGPLAVLQHDNPTATSYLSAVMAIDGVRGGLREEDEHDRVAEAFGAMTAALAGSNSLVRGLQMVHRVVQMDPAEHQEWLATKIPAGVNPVLVDSYSQLVAWTQSRAEQHRNYLVVRIPMTSDFHDAVLDLGANDDENRCRVVHGEMVRCARLATNAGLQRPSGLGERLLGGVLRALQDPDWTLDDHEDVDLTRCWQPSHATKGAVVVGDKWWTRTAVISSDALTPAPVHSRWLGPLLTDVDPSVIRTLSMTMRFVPADKARAQALDDVTSDRSTARGQAQDGRASDGAIEGQMSASAQRLADLRPGGGVHGVEYALAITVTAAGKQQLARACTRIQERAADCGIAFVDWCDGAQDQAAALTWPLGRDIGRPL